MYIYIYIYIYIYTYTKAAQRKSASHAVQLLYLNRYAERCDRRPFRLSAFLALSPSINIYVYI